MVEDPVVRLETESADPIDILVGLAVRRKRREAGLSQDQLGRACGVTFQQVQKYERAANRISCSMLFRIAKALEVNPATLLPDQDHATPSRIEYELSASPQLERVVADYNSLDGRAQRAVHRLMRDLNSKSSSDQAA